MKKDEFITAILNDKEAPEGITKKDATALVDLTFKLLKETIKSESKFAVSGFGTFQKKDRPARDGRNPRTGETIKIAASTTVAFKPSADLKKFLGGK